MGSEVRLRSFLVLDGSGGFMLAALPSPVDRPLRAASISRAGSRGRACGRASGGTSTTLLSSWALAGGTRQVATLPVPLPRDGVGHDGRRAPTDAGDRRRLRDRGAAPGDLAVHQLQHRRGEPAAQPALMALKELTGRLPLSPRQVNNNDYQIARGTQLNVEAGAGLAERCSYLKADFMDLPVEDSSFDAAYAIEATCHAPDATACYRRAPWPMLDEA